MGCAPGTRPETIEESDGTARVGPPGERVVEGVLFVLGSPMMILS